MIDSIMNWFTPNRCAEIALLLFLGIFLAIAIRAMLMPRKVIDESANIPLSDGEAHHHE